jgi:hypothetical protein
VVVLSVLLVLSLVGWFAYDRLAERLGADTCDTTVALDVTASPDLAPAVARAARELSSADPCRDVRVSARESVLTAESLVVPDGAERPDVWIPDSTLWLRRAQARGAWDVPVTGTSVASSPVVLAMTEDAASRFGWPSARPTWRQVLGSALAVGMPDPGREPVGVSLLSGVRAQLGAAPDHAAADPAAADPAAAVTTELRALSANTVPTVADLFTRLPGTASPDTPLDAFPVPEAAVLRHNAGADGPRLVAAYADPAVPALDYPYVVLPGTGDDRRAAAADFLTALLARSNANTLSDAGFRTPDGRMLRERADAGRTSSARVVPAALPPEEVLDQLLNEWSGVNLSGRVQVLLDVSGSMDQAVPGTGRTRMAVTLQAAELGIGLMKPTTKIGVWLFSTDLAGDRDYRELLPMAPIGDLRAGGALERLRAVEAIPGGGTGLYDSTLAAYRSARQNFEPGRINAVVVLTDGRNDDPDSITRQALLAELAKLRDPRRPIRIIGIGIGPDIDVAELRAIAGATGGQGFTTPDPARIGDIFYTALSTLLCQPPECRPPSR